MNSISNTYDLRKLPRTARPMVSILGNIAIGTLVLTTPEGFEIEIGDGSEPRADLKLRKWQALRRIYHSGVIGLAECYRDGLVETANLVALMRLGRVNQNALHNAIYGNRLLQFGYRIRHRLRFNSRRGSARNIEAHYDLGNSFYRLWLDRSMTYSSGRFVEGHDGDLLQSQEAKYQAMLDLVNAKQGERILEIGCGWGGFAEYAAARGFSVHGVTLSRQQLSYAKERIVLAGLSGLATFELRDYRDIVGLYDHVVSIEMLEAVGENYWPTFFAKTRSFLKPGGNAGIQTIVIKDTRFERYRRGTDFIQQYIFPGGMLPSPAKLRDLAARSDSKN